MRREPVLSVLAPGHGATEHVIDRSPYRVGRDPTSELPLDFPWISRTHLVFEVRDGAWIVRSEGRNEARVNGAVLAAPLELSPGDWFELGPMTMIFEAAAARIVELDDRQAPATLELPLSVVFSELHRGADARLIALGELSGDLAGSTDREEVAASAAKVFLATLALRSACVVELEAGVTRVLGATGAPISRLSRGPIERAVGERTTVAADDPGGPVLIAPLGPPSRGAVYGARAGGSFSSEDLAFATVIAHLTGAALAAARKSTEILESNDRLAGQRAELSRDIERRGGFGTLIGTSDPMKELSIALVKVAATDTTVLITGETGTGKELVAREIHQRSPRAGAPFFALNCSALPESLIESELFGHRRGAFSGADADRRGVFELSKGGTVFLDEIGELTLAAQPKLLRVLEAREVLPIGGTFPIPVDVRLVAATHVDLAGAVTKGRFRQDLFYRLQIFPLSLPPLRERREDIQALALHFFEASAEARRKRLKPPTDRMLLVLASYSYPGNVRELAHVIERACILADEGEALDRAHLPKDLTAGDQAPAPSPHRPLREAMAEHERSLIITALEHDGWNRTQAAKRLEISLRAFMDKLKRYEIEEP